MNLAGATTECPHCGIVIEYAPIDAEREVACPTCTKLFILPPVPEGTHAAPVATLAEFRSAAGRGVSHPRRMPWWRLSIYIVFFIMIGALVFAWWKLGASAPLSMGLMLTTLALYLLMGLFLVWLYFLPYVIASKRKHRNTLGILILNAVFGWTLVGWIAALIWAVYEESPARFRP